MMKFKILLLCFFVLAWGMLFAQDPVGGPYTDDGNTVALFHFDGDLNNAASTGGAATGNGDVTFATGMDGMGQAVFLNNQYETDSTLAATSWLSFAHIPELDLVGDWTIEGWFMYADTTFNGLNNPSYLISGRDTLGNFNYRTSLHYTGTGAGDHGNPVTYVSYSSLASEPAWASGPYVVARFMDPVALTPSYDELVGQWLHFTFQRDASQNVIVVAINDADGNLLHYDWRQSHPTRFVVPATSTLPLLMGRLAEGESGLFNGYLDEVRISNSVRYFDFPPVITATFYKWLDEYDKLIPNQLASAGEYPVDMNIFVPGSESGVQNAEVKYRTYTDGYEKVAADDASWQSAAMSQGEDAMWNGGIPSQPGGTMIQHYTEATSTTGKTSNYFAWPDSTYDAFGVYFTAQDKVLELLFEEDDLEFVDTSPYNHDFFTLGQWSIYDDPDDQVQGEFAAWLIEGNTPIGEVVSPFMSLHEYTFEYWWQPDTFDAANNNEYQVTSTLGPNLKDPIRPFGPGEGGAFTTGAWYMDNFALLWRGTPPAKNYGNDTYILNTVGSSGIPWQSGATSTTYNEFGEWLHIWGSLNKDSLSVTVNKLESNGEEVTIGRKVKYATELLADGYTEIKPLAWSFGKLRIGPAALAPAGVHPFNMGKFDKVTVYNYYTEAGPIALSIDDDSERQIVDNYRLDQNYPNPFNPETTIKFMLTRNLDDFSIRVYDNLGRLVKTLHDGEIFAGEHEMTWDATNDKGTTVASGIYYYRMATKGFNETKMMVLVR